MTGAIRGILVVALSAALAGCATLPLPWKHPVPASAMPEGAPPHPGPRPAPDETAAPASLAPGRATGRLGTTVASLGSPAVPGLWLRTPLVVAETPGLVTVGGNSLAVTLVPLPGPKGGGSQLSLAAYRALGLPLTALPELTVAAR